jgi:flagellar FliL protein
MYAKKWYSYCCAMLFSFAMVIPLGAQANAASASGSASAAAGSTAKLEPFVVNLSSFDRYLQATVTLQVASGEIAEKIKVLMPMIRHGLIIILSSKEASQLQTSEGKHEVMDEIKEKVNQVLEIKKEHDGVSEIFFENFIIQ